MKYYVVDAFADELFRGNPAGVCLLERELAGEVMQSIAAENNLPETAFVSEMDGHFVLRWFTPEVEIDLCGHATLASAYVLMNEVYPERSGLSFETQSGTLTVTREGGVYRMNFPRWKPEPVEKHPLLEQALGCGVLEVWKARDWLVLLESEQAVAGLKPGVELLGRISRDIAFGIAVTAKGSAGGFVSRFFAPNAGVVEDPVTGSAHSMLIPFWSGRLNTDEMTARQLSARGGTLFCKDLGERVQIGGTAVCYLKGEIKL